ncbi:MAG: hypothetical protein PHX14_09090 [Syntrophomonadaceae bacterium]|nr:hypothetical protein [Syntrophomonadaceae bacterium]
MYISIGSEGLQKYLCTQLNNFFPDGDIITPANFSKNWDIIIQRTEYCFAQVNNKYFHRDSRVFFNHLNGDHYAMFLYFAANTLYQESQDQELASKLFLLNKYLHAIDAFYEVQLPDIFLFVHPLGTVLGRAKYEDYFVVYQRCNIGSNHDKYPSLGKHLSMHPGSAVLGDCQLGSNCSLAAGALLMDMDLEDNQVYFGNPQDYKKKTNSSKLSIWREG